MGSLWLSFPSALPLFIPIHQCHLHEEDLYRLKHLETISTMDAENEKKPSVNDDFVCKNHVKFFKRCLDVLPAAYSSLDTSRFVHRVIDR